jgi:hypothetical protein
VRLGTVGGTAGLALALLLGGCETIDSMMPSFSGSSSEPQTPASSPPSTTPAQTAAPAAAPAKQAAPAKPPSPPPAAPALASSGPFASGFDCVDGTWCISVASNGDVSIGDPNSSATKMQATARNVLAGQANHQPRNFIVKCVPSELLPQDSHVCRGMDSYGNVYGGNVRSPASPHFFRLLTQASDPATPGLAPFVPGFDCNDATWCLGVAPNGDVYLGNANGYEGAMRPTGKNVLTGQANKQPRSFTIKCVASGTLEDAFVCRGSDSLGNVYAGNSRSAANPNFFKVR